MQRRSIATAIRVLAQVWAFWLIAEIGYAIVGRLGLPLPGNLVGMVLLLVLLASGIVRPSWVEPAATLLVRHLAFFFVPIAVGLMTLGDVLRAQGIGLLAVVLASAGAGIAAAGVVTQVAARRLPPEPATDPAAPTDTAGRP